MIPHLDAGGNQLPDICGTPASDPIISPSQTSSNVIRA